MRLNRSPATTKAIDLFVMGNIWFGYFSARHPLRLAAGVKHIRAFIHQKQKEVIHTESQLREVAAAAMAKHERGRAQLNVEAPQHDENTPVFARIA